MGAANKFDQSKQSNAPIEEEKCESEKDSKSEISKTNFYKKFAEGLLRKI
jgi:hypothetical protein